MVSMRGNVGVLLGKLFLGLSMSDIGRRVLRSFTPIFLTESVFDFFPMGSSERKKAVLSFTRAAFKVLIGVLLDPKIPEAVKKGVLNPIRAFVAANVRTRQSQAYGVCPAFFVMDALFWCNRACYGCYAGSLPYKKGAPVPPLGLIKRVVRQMNEQAGLYYVVISGGEPLLRSEDLFELARTFPYITFMLYTNGDLITDEVIRKMAELGNISVCVSVEGYETETDGRRGKGHFAKITKAMRRLKEAGVVFAISVTITRENADVVTSDGFIKYYIVLGARYAWYFMCIPIGSEEPDISLMITPEQRDHCSKQTKRWREMFPIIVADFWNDGLLVDGCIAGGRRYFHLKATQQGTYSIGPCVFCPAVVADSEDGKPLDVAKVIDGRCEEYGSLMEVVGKAPLFVGYRKKQVVLPPWRRAYAPCIIVDSHRDFCGMIAEAVGVCGHLNTPRGFFEVDSEVSRAITQKGDAWLEFCRKHYL